MKTTNVIAFDIGAGSGRVCVGCFDGDKIVVAEKHRFLNEPVRVLNNLHWDILKVFHELKAALARLDKGMCYLSVGIDGWGADYGLIDRRGRLIGNVYHYRDSRTKHITDKLLEKIPARELFAVTASDLKRHYTLSQLYSQVINGDPLLQTAHRLLLIPDLLTYMFTGSIAAEITIASTSQLLSASGDSWNWSLLSLLGIPETLFPAIIRPGTRRGPISSNYEIETGFDNLDFVAVSGHDTASALASISVADRGSAFVSTGTTIVVGCETESAVINDASFDYGFKNCRGTEGANLLIRNNTGFWILQQCMRLWGPQPSVSFASLSSEARGTKGVLGIFDPESSEFENPDSMPESIRLFSLRTHQEPPVTRAEYTRSIYISLALQVRWCIDGLEIIMGREIESLHLIGGGANDNFFCELVSDGTGLPVCAGPAEATILGNVMVQLQAAREVSSLNEIREVVRRSTETREYLPKHGADDEWDKLYSNFMSYKEAKRTCTKI